MKRENIADIYPLSPLQEGILFQVRGAPNRTDYLVRTAWDVKGRFNVERFRNAWQQVVNRHPILRTGFSWQHSENPLQIVAKELTLPGRDFDWRAKQDAEQHFVWWLEADLNRGFDLRNPPLMRLTTFQLDDSSWRVVWTRHHLLLDGWSGALLLSEVFQLYQGQSLGSPPPPFRHYITWLRQQQQQEAESFWRERLKGFTKPTPLGPMRAQPKQGGKQLEASHDLPKFNPPAGITANTVIQGAWAYLLGRFANTNDVLYGCTVSGRSFGIDQAHRMIGLFINTLPLRVTLDLDAPVGEWLQQLQKDMAGMRANEHHGLTEIRTWSDIPATEAFFNSIVIFENYPADQTLADRAGEEQAQVRLIFRDERTHYPLALYAIPKKDKMVLRMCYDTGLFESESVRQMLGLLGQIVSQMCGQPEQKLLRISLNTPDQSEHLLSKWNQTRLVGFENDSLISFFERQAKTNPTSTALIAGEQVFTYRELHLQAAQFGEVLKSLNLEQGTRIGVALPRDGRMVVSLLAILRSGLAYLPLDPGFPEDRLTYIVEDSKVAQVICDQSYPWLPKEKTLLWHNPPKSVASPEVVLSPEQLAYTIYTSGSTGKPKGVDIPHRAAANLMASMATRPGLGSEDRFLALTTLSFDISVLELFLPLSVGATLVLADKDTATDPCLLIEALKGVSHAQATPATWKMLYAEGWEGQQNLTVWCGGEAVPRELANSLARDTHGFWNMYGPTETTVWSGALPVSQSEEVHIGGAIGNTELHIMDAQQQPLPLGFAGEVTIAGVGLARGYHLRPALTAVKFIPHPFQNGQRLYRTGDLAARCSDGQIRFLGRIDDQVKVRGYRIEIGEIEHVLSLHEQVRDAVVIAGSDARKETVLVAYVAAETFTEELEQALRAHIRLSLPDYMVPGFFETCEAFPLTPNGKIDRKTLREQWQKTVLTTGKPKTGTSNFIHPRDPREAAIQNLFEQVLDASPVSVNANFFQLGGHSLQATKLLARMRKEHALHVSMHHFFQGPTVAELAASAVPFVKLNPIPTAPDEQCSQVSSAQRRFLFLHNFDEKSSAYHLATALRVRGAMQSDALSVAFGKLVQRHPILRTVYQDDVQVVHPEGHIDPSFFNLADYPDHEDACGLAIQKEIELPFDLEQDFPFRLTVYKLAEEQFVVLLVAHHIACDAHSLEIAAGELIALYRSETEGVPANLPQLSVTYGDISNWLATQEHKKERTFWAQKTQDLPALHLPLDKPRPSFQTFTGARLEFEIPKAAGVIRLSQTFGVTNFVCLLTLFKIELAQFARQLDFAVGTPVKGRPRPEMEGVLGCFINNLVLRTDLTGNPSFQELLNRERETVSHAFEHEALSFEEVVTESKAQRDLSRAPLFQVLFNFRVQEAELPSAHALEWTAVDLFDQTSKYELSLIVRQHKQRFKAALEYNTDLFNDATIQAFRDRFLQRLASLTQNPKQFPLSGLQPKSIPRASGEVVSQLPGHGQVHVNLVMTLFSEVLGLRFNDPHGSFFDYGGHSLKAVQLRRLLAKKHGFHISLKTIFLNPSPAQLASQLVTLNRPESEGLPAAPEQSFPALSASQERLWYADQLNPMAGAYHMPLVFRVAGELDLGALNAAVDALVRDHAILRTIFPLNNGKPYQAVLPEYSKQVEILRVPDPIDEAGLAKQLLDWVAQPFDTEAEPPWRVGLVNLKPNQQILGLNQHHLIGDDWSLALLANYFLQAYEALLKGEPAPAVNTRSYLDFSYWQNQALQSGGLAKEKSYWQTQLRNCQPMVLPEKRFKDTNAADHVANQVFLSFNDDEKGQLVELASQLSTTLYNVLLSGWQVVLHRYGVGRDIRVGTSIAGREISETETMLGCFVNTLVMRYQFSKPQSFTEMLVENHGQIADALEHGQLPFEEVVQLVNQKKEELFSAFFVFHTAGELARNIGHQTNGLSGATLSPWVLPAKASRFDLSLSISEDTAGLRGALTFKPSRFEDQQITVLAQHFKSLLLALCNSPQARLQTLPLLSDAEYQKWCSDSANPLVEKVPTGLVLEQVLEHAKVHPEHIALADSTQQLTYQELADQVLRVAGLLQENNLAPEEAVALLAKRRSQTVVFMLAVQAAGGVCLPLEEDTPSMRLSLIAKDAGVRFLIGTDEDKAFGSGNWVFLDVAQAGAPTKPIGLQDQQLAYLIYTSGSTGSPKAVGISHKNLCAYVNAISSHLTPQVGDAWMLVTTLAADLCLTSLYPGLASGGTVHILEKETVLDASSLAAEIAERQIDYLKCTPTWFRSLLDIDFPEMAIPQKALLLGGEAFDPQIAATIMELADTAVYNHYGPTETTIGMVLHQVESGALPLKELPIGKPLAGGMAVVCDDALQPLPEQLAGELLLGGPQLARGYLGDPKLTARKFIPNPFGSHGSRLYRTGDRALRLAQGSLLFLGRADQQLKIRGFRIELGEIEGVIKQWALDAHVLATQDSGSLQLVAFVSGLTSGVDLENELAQHLPSHMIPSSYVFLETMPTTVNGKRDIAALKDLASKSHQLEAVEFVAPRSEMEKTLATIWGSLLDVERVGIHDDFFKLGGDSIIAIQAMIRMKKAGHQMAPTAFLANPTISDQVALLQKQPTSNAVATSHSERLQSDLIPLSPIQSWFFEKHGKHSPQHFNQAMFLELKVALSKNALHRLCESLIQQHEVFGFCYSQQQGEWVQKRMQQRLLSFEEIVLDAADQATQTATMEHVAKELQTQLVLETGSLHRMVVFRTEASQPDRLLLILHHLIVDGVSWRILLEDLESMYFEESSTNQPNSASLFSDYSQALTAALPKFKTQREQWTLIKPPPEVPVLHGNGPNNEASTKACVVVLEEAITKQLLSAKRFHIHTYLLTALGKTFQRIFGHEYMVVNLEGHGRDQDILEYDANSVVGWLTSVYPVELAWEADLESHLERTNASLKAITHNGMAFGALRFLDKDPEIRAIADYPNVIFNYLGQFDAVLRHSRLFDASSENPGPTHGADQIRDHLLDVNASVLNGRMRMAWRYSENLFDPQTVETLAQTYLAQLKKILDHDVRFGALLEVGS